MSLVNSKLTPLALLFALATNGYAQTAHWVYGVKNAQQIQSTSSGSYYLSLATFKNKNYANAFYQKIKRGHHYPVHISSKNGFHNVFIGPVSAEKLQTISNELSHKKPSLNRKQSSQPVITTKTQKQNVELAPSMPSTLTPVATLSIGSSWTHGNNTNLLLAPEITNTYSVTNGDNAFIIGEVFGGAQTTLSSGWLGQAGVFISGSGKAPIAGEIWADTNPNFNNFIYNYSINHTAIGIKAKVLKETNWFSLQPYLSGGIGLAFNYAHGYSSMAVIPEEVIDPPFPSNITQSFTYTAGAGIQKSINPHWAGGVGYEFSDWGQTHLGTIPGQTTTTGINLKHLYNNAVVINLTYLR